MKRRNFIKAMLAVPIVGLVAVKAKEPAAELSHLEGKEVQVFYDGTHSLDMEPGGINYCKCSAYIDRMERDHWSALIERHHANLFPTLGDVTDEELGSLYEPGGPPLWI